MLAENLTVSATASSLANIGTQSGTVFALVALGADGSTRRRVAATALTDRQEILIRHQITGKGWLERARMNLRVDLSKINQDTSLTGGVTPSASVSVTIDRPLKMAAIMTDVAINNAVGFAIQMFLTAGNIAAFHNQEA